MSMQTWHICNISHKNICISYKITSICLHLHTIYVKQVGFLCSPIHPTPPPSSLFHGTKCEKFTEEEEPLTRGASILGCTKWDVSFDAGEFDDMSPSPHSRDLQDTFLEDYFWAMLKYLMLRCPANLESTAKWPGEGSCIPNIKLSMYFQVRSGKVRILQCECPKRHCALII